MIRTNAIIFVRATSDPQSFPEVFTSATASDVTTEAANVQSDGKFTASPFSGVAVQFAKLLVGCQVSNVSNNSSTIVINQGASSQLLWGAANDNQGEQRVLVATELILANSGNNNLDVNAAEVFSVTGPSTAFDVSGFEHPDYVVQKTLINNSGQTMTLLNDDSGSDVGNRIITGTGSDVDIATGASVDFSYVPALNGWQVTAGAPTANEIPTQSGHSGEFLTTNGTALSWAAPLPDQTGNAGKFLTTDGTDASWDTPAGLSGKALMVGGTYANSLLANKFYAMGGQRGANGAATADITAVSKMPMAGTLKNFYIESDAAAGGDEIFVVYKNGVATTITATIPNAGSTASDTTHTVAVVAGDKISLHYTVASAGTINDVAWGIELDPS